MPVVIITGASGLIGSEAALFFASKGFDIVGVDNDMRRYFFGDDASTSWRRQRLERSLTGYRHVAADIRDEQAMDQIFRTYGREVALVIHTAAQPSHDWAAREPLTDFTVNANGTLVASGDDAAPLPRCALHLHEHEQGLRRHAEPPAARRTRDALDRGRQPPLRRARHRRNHEHRSDDAQRVRRLEGGGRRHGAGIRAVFRLEDGLFSRRVPDGSGARRRRTARISLLPREVRGHRAGPTRSSATRASRSGTTSIPTIW